MDGPFQSPNAQEVLPSDLYTFQLCPETEIGGIMLNVQNSANGLQSVASVFSVPRGMAGHTFYVAIGARLVDNTRSACARTIKK